jgi:hypothetical protein
MTDGQITGFWVGYAIVVVVGLAVHILLSHAIGKAAERRNRSYWAFFWLSFFVSWIIMGIIVATLPKPPSASGNPSPEDPVRLPGETAGAGSAYSLTEQSETVACPFCAEEIKAKADICRFCNRDVSKQRKEREAAEEKARKEQEIRLAAEAAVLEKELRHAEEKARQDAAIEAAARKEAERKALETELLRREARLKFWRSPKGTAVVLVLAAITIAGGTTAVVQVSIASSERAARMAWADKIGVCKHAPSGIRITSVTNAASMELEVRSGSDSKTITLSPAEKTFLDCLQAKVLDVHTASNQSLANTLVDSSKVLLGFDMTLEVAQPEGGSAPAKPGTVRIWSEYKNGKWFVVLSPGSDY